MIIDTSTHFTVRELCKVIYSYKPAYEDELELKEGDIITILNKDLPDKGWWKGELKGKVGVFPDNFVHLVAGEGESNVFSITTNANCTYDIFCTNFQDPHTKIPAIIHQRGHHPQQNC